MNLNDDVEDGLEEITESPDINPDAPTPPPVILANKTEPPEPEDNDINNVPATRLFGSPIVPGELPNLDAEFIITTEITNKASDIANVQSAIGGHCSMCQEDALAVDSVVPGFINSDRPLGFFTENRTKTQLTQTMASLESAIDLQLIELKDACMKTTEKLVPIYREMHQKASENIQSVLVKYQFALGEISVGNASRNNSDALRSLLVELDNNIPRNYCLGDSVGSGNFKSLLERVCLLANRLDNRRNIANLCYRFREDVRKNAFGMCGLVYEIIEAEPYVVLTSTEETAAAFDNSVSFSDLLYNGTDMVSINYLQGLLNLSVSFTEAMVRSAALMEEASKKPDLTAKQRLDFMTQIVSVNNTYARQCGSIFAFMNDYFEMFDSIVGTVLDVQSKNKPMEVNVTPKVEQGT